MTTTEVRGRYSVAGLCIMDSHDVAIGTSLPILAQSEKPYDKACLELVRRANAYDALVEALQDLLTVVDGANKFNRDYYHERKNARAILESLKENSK